MFFFSHRWILWSHVILFSSFSIWISFFSLILPSLHVQVFRIFLPAIRQHINSIFISLYQPSTGAWRYLFCVLHILQLCWSSFINLLLLCPSVANWINHTIFGKSYKSIHFISLQFQNFDSELQRDLKMLPFFRMKCPVGFKFNISAKIFQRLIQIPSISIQKNKSKRIAPWKAFWLNIYTNLYEY